jgi:arylsulfatase A-like enzyme
MGFRPHYFLRTVSSALAILALCSACAPAGPGKFQLAADVERPPRNVVVFVADGMDYGQMQEMLDAGFLPNIRRTFVEGGVQVRHAIASMPSVTYPNNSSIITGRFPGHHGIMGNFWFERSRLISRDYMTLQTARDVNAHLAAPTIYDLLADRLTVSILAQSHKGVGVSLDLQRTFAWGWILGRYIAVDRRVAESITDVFTIANRVGQWPTILHTYYPGVDEVGHRSGPDSSEYAAALENVDKAVGLITDAIATAGLTRSTYFVLLSDHGMVPIRPGQDFRFIRWLERERRLRVRTRPLDDEDFVDRFDTIQRYDAVASVDAGRVSMVHLRGQRGWLHRPDGQEVYTWAHLQPAVHELPAVGMVAARAGPNMARGWSREGSLVVERRFEEGQRLYRIVEHHGDPLGYLQSPELAQFVRAGWHDSREWLAATVESRHPDFVPQVVEMFDSPRTGDLVVFASEDWLLYRGEKAGHGSTLHRDMRLPMYFTGPDLPPGGEIPLGRLVDLMPTVLGLLGEAHRLEAFPPIDGIDLSGELVNARVPEPTLRTPTPPRPVPPAP